MGLLRWLLLWPEGLEGTRSSDGSVVVLVLTGSSTDISEDWEKDFDLDMTEEEVQLVLSKVEVSGEVSAGEALAQPGEKAARGRRWHFIGSLGGCCVRSALAGCFAGPEAGWGETAE